MPDTTTPADESRAAATSAREARSGYIAVTVFPLLIILGGVVGYFAADTVSPVSYTHLTLPTNREV